MSLDFRLQPAGGLLPYGRAAPDAMPPRPVGTVIREAPAKDPPGPEPDLARELMNERLLGLDDVGASLAVLTVIEHAADGLDPAAHAVPRFEHGDAGPFTFERPGARESRESGADHDDVAVAECACHPGSIAD